MTEIYILNSIIRRRKKYSEAMVHVPDKRTLTNLWLLHISEFPSHVLSGTFLCTLLLKTRNKILCLHSTVQSSGSAR